MPEPRFITSDAQIGAAGLYIQERAAPAIVEGVQNNVVAMAGTAVRGPVNRRVEITSPGRFVEVFGGRDILEGGPIASELWKALLNKRFGKFYAVRAAASAAAASTVNLEDGDPVDIVQVDASSVGTWGDGVTVSVVDATDGDEDHFDLVVKWRNRTDRYRNLNVNGEDDDNLAAVVGDDDGRLVTLIKLADGRPENVADVALTTGADGTLDDTDFTAAAGPLDILAATKDAGIKFVAGQSTTAVKSAVETKSAADPKALWLICPDDETETKSDAVTESTGMTPNKRLVYCFNHPKTLDPQTATLITVEPTSWMASILSQTDADVHPGVADNKQFLTGIAELTFESLAPEDYDDLRDARICGLERDRGFSFVDAVTLDPAYEVDQRRVNDFLIASIALFLETSVKEPNTPSRRIANKSSVGAFLDGLARQERYVAKNDSNVPQYQIDTESLNTQATRDAGKEATLYRIKTIPKMLFVVLVSEIGTTVNVTEQ